MFFSEKHPHIFVTLAIFLEYEREWRYIPTNIDIDKFALKEKEKKKRERKNKELF
jgi:hypothetical protein